MKLEKITDLFCLSCFLISFYVHSQTTTGCPSGWFGSRCQYKCRCAGDNCDKNGQCTNSTLCLGGWFGAKCQYVDLAYNRTDDLLTDGDDSTCTNLTVADTVRIVLGESILFTWLRAVFKDKGSTGYLLLSLTLSMNSVPVNYLNAVDYVANETVLDISCKVNSMINTLELSGYDIGSLCSVYVNGGRNVALKEKAHQDSSLPQEKNGIRANLTADKAVDGDTRQHLDFLACTYTNATNVWRLFLSQPRMVHRYIIYNRVDYGSQRLNGFKLEAYDSRNRSVFVHKDPKTEFESAELIYKIWHQPVAINMIIVTSYNSDKYLTLCEVEVYGDSSCDNENHGLECEKKCQCPDHKACSASTGACVSCPPGYKEPNCSTECVASYGRDCSHPCSSHCGKAKSCVPSSGTCRDTLCMPGYLGRLCTDKCKKGTYGWKCNYTCNQECAPPDNANQSPCNNENGKCVNGCNFGFTEDKCNEKSHMLEYIIGLCLVFAILFFILFWVVAKRRSRQPQTVE